MAAAPRLPSLSSGPEPTWNVALLFPCQGDWSEADYLRLTNDTNQLVELVDGHLEVLSIPKTSHQLIVQYLFVLLRSFVADRDLGEVFFAGLRFKIRPRTIREPDVVYVSSSNISGISDDYATAADLAMEVVSPDDQSHDRDYNRKKLDYAEAGIKEYWIVDPRLERITVLVLEGEHYRVHGEYSPGDNAVSHLLADFTVDVAATFAEGKKLK
jgi:Uma2 family endonuclease